jgi:hypothetical protein
MTVRSIVLESRIERRPIADVYEGPYRVGHLYPVVLRNHGVGDPDGNGAELGGVLNDARTGVEVFWPTKESWRWWHDRLRTGTTWDSVKLAWDEFKGSVAARYDEARTRAAVERYAVQLTQIRAVLDAQKAYMDAWGPRSEWTANQTKVQSGYWALKQKYVKLAEALYGTSYPTTSTGEIVMSGDIAPMFDGTIVDSGWRRSRASQFLINDVFGVAQVAAANVVLVVGGIAVAAVGVAAVAYFGREIVVAWEQASLERDYMATHEREFNALVRKHKREFDTNVALVKEGFEPVPYTADPNFLEQPNPLHDDGDGAIIIGAGIAVSVVAVLALWKR